VQAIIQIKDRNRLLQIYQLTGILLDGGGGGAGMEAGERIGGVDI
jgi:hypothetical protein